MGRLSIEMPTGLHWEEQRQFESERTVEEPPRIVEWFGCWADG